LPLQRLKMKTKINLGCGSDIKEDYLNVDMIHRNGVNLILDIENQMSILPSDHFEEIYMNHSLEHISNFMEVMKQIHRISKDGTKLFINCPHFSSIGMYSDPTHKTFFSSRTFNLFSPDRTENIYSDIKLKTIKKELRLTYNYYPGVEIVNWILNTFPAIYERCFCWIFPCNEIRYELEVMKNSPVGEDK